MNRGAHYVPDNILLLELNHTLLYMKKKYGDKISIIFRSTAPGHTNFQEARYLIPLKNKLEAKIYSKNLWHEFEHQNKLVKELLDQYYPNVLFLDVYPSSVLRHDGHTTEDGLHYCIPGPIDNWTVLLYNLLDILEQVHDHKTLN